MPPDGLEAPSDKKACPKTSKRIADVINVNTGISDFHHLIGFSTKLHFPRKLRKKFVYRSYRNFDELEYKQDMSVIPYHVGEIFDDIDDQCWFTQKLISSVIDIMLHVREEEQWKSSAIYEHQTAQNMS